jgi:hypothetical protein
VVVKFVEGSKVRLRESGLVNMGSGILTPATDILLQSPGMKVERLFTRPEDDLEMERVSGQNISGKQLADLNNYYMLTLPEGLDVGTFIDALNAMDIVEIAYPEPIPQPAHVPSDIPPKTPKFESSQGYLNPAPTGVDALYAWTQGGGRGQGVQFADVEGGWQIGHEDLDIHSADLVGGTNSTAPAWRQHGTAVLGEVIGHKNGYGIKGIAHKATAKMSSIFGQTTANAINTAASNLNPGDIILIELHAPGPASGETCECNCGQFDFIAMEYWTANFDAMLAATANGIIVVEAAGNGGMDLDHSRYGGAFDRSVRDSGAIIVGAGTSSVPHNPMCWTNYGNRIDSYGWGENVVTTGYGGLFNGGSDINQYYTSTFSGTSSASPIVVGAAASLQGRAKNRGADYLSPGAIRQILTGTGTTQGFGGSWGNKHIATLPNLKNAIAYLKGKINFDIVEAPCLFNQTTALRNEFRKLGAKFRGKGLKNGGAVLDECGNFSVTGHSSPNFLAFNCGSGLSDGGIPRLPERIIFKSPLPDKASLRIGSGLSVGEVVKIKAKNSSGTIVDSSNVTLAPDLQSVLLSGGNIKKLILSGNSACIAVVDDVYYGGCMTGEYTDSFGIKHFLVEDSAGNISGYTDPSSSCDDVPWVVSGSRSGSNVTFKVTNPALDACCFSYTVTGTTGTNCNTINATWLNDGGICSGSGSITFGRSGITAPEPPAITDGPGPMERR